MPNISNYQEKIVKAIADGKVDNLKSFVALFLSNNDKLTPSAQAEFTRLIGSSFSDSNVHLIIPLGESKALESLSEFYDIFEFLEHNKIIKIIETDGNEISSVNVLADDWQNHDLRDYSNNPFIDSPKLKKYLKYRGLLKIEFIPVKYIIEQFIKNKYKTIEEKAIKLQTILSIYAPFIMSIIALIISIITLFKSQ